MLTEKFVGEVGARNFYIITCARTLAESQVYIELVRAAKWHLLRKIAGAINHDQKTLEEYVDDMRKMARYERRAYSRRKNAARALEEAVYRDRKTQVRIA